MFENSVCKMFEDVELEVWFVDVSVESSINVFFVLEIISSQQYDYFILENPAKKTSDLNE